MKLSPKNIVLGADIEQTQTPPLSGTRNDMAVGHLSVFAIRECLGAHQREFGVDLYGLSLRGTAHRSDPANAGQALPAQYLPAS